MPNKEVLEEIARVNSDGFGFVSTKSYYRTLDKENFFFCLSQVGDDEECIMHFRYATQGSISRLNCHPFREGDLFFAHNGVLPYYPQIDITDSEYCFRVKILPAFSRYGFDSQAFDRVVQREVRSSRFAFMYRGVVKLFGNYEEIEGCYYSNTRWRVLFAQSGFSASLIDH